MTNRWLGCFVLFVVMAGASPAHAITGSGSTINFLDRRVSAGAAGAEERTFTVTNTTTMLVTLTSSVTGDYTIVTSPTSVPATSSVNFLIRFVPTAAGARAGSLVIVGDTSLNIALLGTGTVAQIGVGDAAFGDVRTTTVGAANIAVTNTSAGPGMLRLTSAAIDLQSQPWFAIATQPTNIDLGPGATHPIPVRCSPPLNATGTATARITVTSDADAPQADVVGTLTCTAVQASATVSTMLVAFGDVAVGANTSQMVTVTNNGPLLVTYNVSAIAAPYTYSGGCTVACDVTPGTSRTFTVRFAPTAVGPQNTNVVLTTSAPNLDMRTITVTGRGTGALISPTPPTVAVGNVDAGFSGAADLVVTNTGNSNLVITSATLLAGSDLALTVTPPSATQTLPPNDIASWTFTCAPTTPGPKTGTFRILSNATNDVDLDVAVTCTGLQGRLTSVTATVPFGGVPISTTRTIQVSVTNPGNTPVTGILSSVTPSDLGYSVAPAGPVTIAGGGTQVFDFVFAPLAPDDGGAATATFMGTWGTGRNATLAIPISGMAQASGFELVPAAGIDFGVVPYTDVATRTICALNSNPADLTISGVTLETFMAGAGVELPPEYRRGDATCTAMGGTIPSPNIVLAFQQSLVITVRWNARSFGGPLNGIIRVSSSAPTLTSRTAMIVGTSATGTIEVGDGGIVDFGPTDIQAGGVTRQVTVTNTGLAPLVIMSVSMPTNPVFAVVIAPNLTIPAGTATTFTVRYTPMVAMAAGMADEGEIALLVTGDVDLLPLMTQRIRLTGRGTDRDIMVDQLPTFPETFLNAGSLGPVADVLVRNAGEAPLRVSGLTIVGTGSFSLVDPGAQVFEVPGFASKSIAVRFSPNATDLNTEMLEITHDDVDTTSSGTNTLLVELSGRGKVRGVMLTGDSDTMPGLSVGLTGTNFPIEVANLITIENRDPASSFTISDLVIDGGDRVFSLVEDPIGVMLAPLETRRFSVRFAPTAEDTFEYTAEVVLFLDENPVMQDSIALGGRAVFVDARGGGGCATTGGSTGGAAWLIGLVGLVLAGRRRRRRRATAGLVAAAVMIAGPASSAVADDLVLSTFDPTPETQPTNFQVQSGVVGAAGAWVATAAVSYATDPLVQFAIDNNGTTEQAVIERSSLLQIGGAYAFLDRWEVGARMPLYRQDGATASGNMDVFSSDPVSGNALGDLVLHGKMRLVDRPLTGKGRFAFAAGAQLTLPTATDGAFTGVEHPTGKVLALASLMPGAFSNRVSLSANVGAVLRATSEYANLEQRSGVAWGLGLQIRALDRLWLAGEMFGTWMPSGRIDEDGQDVALSPTEWLAGLKVRPDHRLAIGLAAGRGLTSAVGTPALRGVLSLTFTPYAEKLGPIHPPPPPKPDGDEDGDGIRDSKDPCPREAEDLDAFEDTDGCPELDNDKDGIPDLKDRCPLDEEDLDKFEDLDGCPELDNDQDGIPDAIDQCSTQPEDKDGFEDDDGCPELDNDKDGILDGVDRCPLKAEVVNGNKDDDGCPDSGEALVLLSSDKLDVMESIAFARDSTKFAGKATNVLGQVAATLRAHPEILKVRVTCHVNPSGNEQRDQELSEARATAVREWLVKWGVAEGRLDTRGFGGKKPLAKSGRNAAVLNDRVELIILERQ